MRSEGCLPVHLEAVNPNLLRPFTAPGSGKGEMINLRR
ncbi:hypothetical protein D187_001801 [Cystobacter fuscus DSM 2262]|uniref:Uncharacterized protein n=1 Tax=Cystobacter fuscus (strain ATCC 25194 / DSM 2262 / NBRC 100088 / M29) TaxID=1242864 RepID=S9QG78_CYSF2|nr:hypothetical protein D187_001801 [Cystobacter fuscus DSM 2262]